MAVIPNTNINLATNIRDVLNAAGGSVTNDVTTFFTEAAKINPFSKHKPVVLNTNFCQDFDSTKPNYDAEWWLGSSRMCGLEFFPMLNYATDLPSKYDGDMNGWIYNLPQGGESQPLRLGDFIGYDTDATPPINGIVVHDMANNSNAEKIAMSANVKKTNTTSISFLDMPTLKNYYLGAYIKHQTYSNAVVATSESPLTDGQNSVNINPYGLRSGTYNVYPFISEERQTQNQPGITNIIYTIPGVKPLTLKIMSTTDMYTVSVQIINATAFSIEVRITIVNNTASAKTFTNNVLMIRMNGVDFDEPLTVDDYRANLDSITVEGNSTKNVIHTANIRGLSELQTGGVVYVSLDSASIIKNTTYTINGSGGIM